MDPRVAGAGVAMAVAMLLLLPTFNALNNSYATDVPPPSWMPPPDKIPENFQPPEDMEYPEGWEPPPNVTPPPGWEPPPGYEGPIPPEGCPPPVFRPVEAWTDSGSWSASAGNPFPIEKLWTPPKYTVGFGGNITFTNWRAQSVSYEILDPSGEAMDADFARSNTPLLMSPQPTARSQFTFQTDDPRETGELPAEGEYTLILDADTALDGSWEIEFVVAIACGGMLE